MAAAGPVPSLSSAQNALQQLRHFPIVSGAHASLHLERLVKALQTYEIGSFDPSGRPLQRSVARVAPTAANTTEPRAASPSGDTEGDAPAPQAGFQAMAISFLVPTQSNLTVTQKAGMTVVCYLAMQAFATLSFYINGAVGGGKIALAVVVAITNKDQYKTAQNLMEEGVYHLLVAAADFAIAYFTFARAGLALGYGFAPEATQKGFERFYKPWKGAITHTDGASADQIAKDRKDYCWLQGVADAIQNIAMPDGDANRFKAAWAALQGKQFVGATSPL